MKTLTALLVVAAIALSVPALIYPEYKEMPCCFPDPNKPGEAEICEMHPTWQCERLGGRVVESCGECLK